MTPSKRQYRRDMKLEAVKRVEQGASIRAVAKELKIPSELLQAWVEKRPGLPQRARQE